MYSVRLAFMLLGALLRCGVEFLLGLLTLGRLGSPSWGWDRREWHEEWEKTGVAGPGIYTLPPTEFRSRGGRYALRVEGDKDVTLSLYQVACDAPIWSRVRSDGHGPAQAYVADDGCHVVFRYVEDTSCFSAGKLALRFIGPGGKELRRWDAAELLTESEQLEGAVLRRWGPQTPGWFSFLDRDARFAFVAPGGAVGCFDVASGTAVPLDEDGTRRVREAAAADVMRALESPGAQVREFAAELCPALDARAAVPRLLRLLEDRTVTGTGSQGSGLSAPIYGVQIAAAWALVSLVGSRAIPLIEAEARRANHIVRSQLLDALSSLDGGPLGLGADSPLRDEALALWHRLAASRSRGLRQRAVTEILWRGDAEYVFARPGLLASRDENVRSLAVRCLAEKGDERAVPALRKVLAESDGPIRFAAFRGLVRLGEGAALGDLLRRGFADADVEIRLEAVATAGALAALGDADALVLLREFAGRGDAFERAKSIRMLALAGDKASLPFLRESLRHREPRVREAAAEALRQLEGASTDGWPRASET